MRKLLVLLAIMTFAEFAMAQTYTGGATGITGADKLGAHQNGGRGCVGCHAPHSGARGNGGNALGGAVTDPDTGNYALWGQDLGPLYTTTLNFGEGGDFPITLPTTSSGLNEEDEQVLTGVVMYLSCHDGNVATGAMMTNQVCEKVMGLLPSGYGPQPIPTLLGNDGTAPGNYQNDHPIGPAANLGAVGVASRLMLFDAGSLCESHGTPVACLEPDPSNSQYMAFYNNYGAFNITQSATDNSTTTPVVYASGGRTTGVVIPAGATDATTAYLVCTTCHTPHTMYIFSGTAGGVKGTYPSYFFISAPYNPGATPSLTRLRQRRSSAGNATSREPAVRTKAMGSPA